MKIEYDEYCTFGDAFEKAYIQYRTRTKSGNTYDYDCNARNNIIYWCNRIYDSGYEVVAIKNFDAKKLFKWAGIDDYPNSLPGHLQDTRKV